MGMWNEVRQRMCCDDLKESRKALQGVLARRTQWRESANFKAREVSETGIKQRHTKNNEIARTRQSLNHTNVVREWNTMRGTIRVDQKGGACAGKFVDRKK
eukprot:3740073-Pleurochrysis_carterae.AAC.1